MKIKIFLWIFMVLIFVSIVWCHTVTTKVVHVEAKEPWANGFWQKKVVWKSRWVKTWIPKQIYVGLWKKVWGPVVLNEWVPLPKPPPGWLPKH